MNTAYPPLTTMIDFHVVGEENVYPMVPAGSSITDMLRRPLEEEEML